MVRHVCARQTARKSPPWVIKPPTTISPNIWSDFDAIIAAPPPLAPQPTGQTASRAEFARADEAVE